MSQVSCSDEDKEWFEEFKESDENQQEAFARLVAQAKAYNGEVPDEERIAEETADKMGPKLELVVMRVANELNSRS